MRYRAQVTIRKGGGTWMNKNSCHHYRWYMKPFIYFALQVIDTTTGEVVDSDNGYGSLASAVDDAHRRIARKVVTS